MTDGPPILGPHSSSIAVVLELFIVSSFPCPETDFARLRAKVLEESGRESVELFESIFSCLVDHTNAFDL